MVSLLVPEESKKEINKPGKNVTKYDILSAEDQRTLTLANNWGVAHAYPINTYQASLSKKN